MEDTANFIPRNIKFDPETFEIIQRVAKESGAGPRGFGATVRRIVREWAKENECNDAKQDETKC